VKISDCCMPAAPYRGPAIKPGAACSNSVAIYVAIFRKQNKASFSDALPVPKMWRPASLHQ